MGGVGRHARPRFDGGSVMADLSLDDIQAELARRDPASAPTPDTGLSVDDIAGELAKRQAAAAPNTSTVASPPVASPPTSPVALGGGLGIVDNMAAAAQGVSPHVGASATLAAPEEQWHYAEMGHPRDTTKFVVLRNPDTGQPAVYNRTPDMEENPLASLGRMFGLAVPEAGIPGAAGTAAAPALSPAQSLLQDFDKVGVTPNLPAVGQGRSAGLVSQIANTLPIVGPTVRKAANTSLADTMAAADRIAGTYGQGSSPLDAGDAIQSGIRAFAKGQAPEGSSLADIIAAPTRDSGFPAKSGALYDRFEQTMDPQSPVAVPNYSDALHDVRTSMPNARNTASILEPSLAQGLGMALVKDTYKSPLTWQDVKSIRTQIGARAGEPQLTGDATTASLRRLYGALSEDMGTAAEAAGPEALNAFNRANQYYKAGTNRLEQLEPFTSGSPEQAFAMLNRAASNGSGADVGTLTALQRSMPPDQWGNVGATVIRKLGEPTPGAKDILGEGFSPSSFATNWNKLSDPAKDVLFGANTPNTGRDSLESLARVAQAQKNVSKLANASHSGEVGLMGGLGALAVEHRDQLMAHPLATAAALLAARTGGQALMAPATARWLYAAPPTIATPSAGMSGAQRSLTGIDALARAGQLMSGAPMRPAPAY